MVFAFVGDSTMTSFMVVQERIHDWNACLPFFRESVNLLSHSDRGRSTRLGRNDRTAHIFFTNVLGPTEIILPFSSSIDTTAPTDETDMPVLREMSSMPNGSVRTSKTFCSSPDTGTSALAPPIFLSPSGFGESHEATQQSGRESARP